MARSTDAAGRPSLRLSAAVARQAELSPGAAAVPPSWMGDSERARWLHLNPDARAAFAAARWLLRGLLEKATGVPAGDWTVSAVAGREPRASARGLAADAVRVSLSHRLGWVAAAVSDTPVGIDLECARPARSDVNERAALMLAPDELLTWNAHAPDARESALLTRWTAKEAWFKAAPAQDAAWDLRRVVARACAPGHANVRAWAAPPLHVAVSCADAHELAQVGCAGLDPAGASTFWHLGLA